MTLPPSQVIQLEEQREAVSYFLHLVAFFGVVRSAAAKPLSCFGLGT